MIDQKPRSGAHDSKVAFIHPKSSNGVLIELVDKCNGCGLCFKVRPSFVDDSSQILGG